MYSCILDAQYRGWILADKWVAPVNMRPFVCDTAVIPTKDSSYLVFRKGLNSLVPASFTILEPDVRGIYNLPFGPQNFNKPVPNLQRCELSSGKAVISFNYYSTTNFKLWYPNFPTTSSVRLAGVLRVSFNGESHFFDMTEKDCTKLRRALGYYRGQRWTSLFCSNIESIPTQQELQENFCWTTLLGSHVF